MTLVEAPAAQGRNDEIEVLRAIAMLMVFVDHMPFNLFDWHSGLGDVTAAYWRGSAGIDLFLAISGFVIGRSLLPALAAAAPGPAFAAVAMRFLQRRFWRLQPALAVWVIIPLVLSVVFNSSGAFHPFMVDLRSGVTALTGINNIRFAQIYGRSDAGVTFPLWVLSLVEQFYVLLPLLALVFRRHLAWAMAALVVLQFAAPADPIFLFTRTAALALGVLLALWEPHAARAMTAPVFLSGGRRQRFAFVAGLVLLIGALQSELGRPLVTLPYAVSAVLSAVLVHAASFDRGYIMRPGLVRQAFVWLGSRSYAVFLTHVPAFALTRELYARYRPPVFEHPPLLAAHYLVVAVVITLAASELTYRLVEKPARAHGRLVTSELAT